MRFCVYWHLQILFKKKKKKKNPNYCAWLPAGQDEFAGAPAGQDEFAEAPPGEFAEAPTDPRVSIIRPHLDSGTGEARTPNPWPGSPLCQCTQ